MNYSEAEKATEKLPVPEGYMRIALSYSSSVILPYKKAVALLALLEGGEFLEERYGAAPTIRPLGKDDVQFFLMSADERRRNHMAQLLNVPVSELDQVKQMEDPPPF